MVLDSAVIKTRQSTLSMEGLSKLIMSLYTCVHNMMSRFYYKMLWMRINIGLNSDKLASYQTQPTYRSWNIGHLKNIYTWSNFWWRQIAQVCPDTQAAYFMHGGEILNQQNISFRVSQRRSVTVHKMRIETLTFWISVQFSTSLIHWPIEPHSNHAS